MLTPIEIDFEIHKAIENERRSFEEPPYVALRRLLKLPDAKITQPAAVASVGRPWREGAVEVPHGAEARMTYQRGSQVFEGQFLNGRLVVNGQSFETLSGAASALARTKDGAATSLNGWNYWEVKFPGRNEWLPFKLLRRGGRKARF
ncbi:MAG: hypothetical protein ACR2FK_06450 [Sphingomicrobium sp.]